MSPTISAPAVAPTLSRERELLAKNANVLVIDDEMSGAVALSMANKIGVKSAHYFQVEGIRGDTPDAKIAHFMNKLESFLKEKGVTAENLPNLIVLDRNLRIGDLPLPQGDTSLEAAGFTYNDGPGLIPALSQRFPGVKFLANTGEFTAQGISSIYGGAPIVPKPCPSVEIFADGLCKAFCPNPVSLNTLFKND